MLRALIFLVALGLAIGAAAADTSTLELRVGDQGCYGLANHLELVGPDGRVWSKWRNKRPRKGLLRLPLELDDEWGWWLAHSVLRTRGSFGCNESLTVRDHAEAVFEMSVVLPNRLDFSGRGDLIVQTSRLTGGPAVGVELSLRGAGREPVVARTDEHGLARLPVDGVEAVHYRLEARRGPFREGLEFDLEIPSSVEIRAEKTSYLVGEEIRLSVVDPGRVGIPQDELILELVDACGELVEMRSTLTDDAGSSSISWPVPTRLNPGRFWIRAPGGQGLELELRDVDSRMPAIASHLGGTTDLPRLALELGEHSLDRMRFTSADGDSIEGLWDREVSIEIGQSKSSWQELRLIDRSRVFAAQDLERLGSSPAAGRLADDPESVIVTAPFGWELAELATGELIERDGPVFKVRLSPEIDELVAVFEDRSGRRVWRAMSIEGPARLVVERPRTSPAELISFRFNDDRPCAEVELVTLIEGVVEGRLIAPCEEPGREQWLRMPNRTGLVWIESRRFLVDAETAPAVDRVAVMIAGPEPMPMLELVDGSVRFGLAEESADGLGSLWLVPDSRRLPSWRAEAAVQQIGRLRADGFETGADWLIGSLGRSGEGLAWRSELAQQAAEMALTAAEDRARQVVDALDGLPKANDFDAVATLLASVSGEVDDPWGQRLRLTSSYEREGLCLELVSDGLDGQSETADDLVMWSSSPDSESLPTEPRLLLPDRLWPVGRRMPEALVILDELEMSAGQSVAVRLPPLADRWSEAWWIVAEVSSGGERRQRTLRLEADPNGDGFRISRPPSPDFLRP